MEEIKTSVEIWGLTVAEPMTVATDFLVAAVCLYAYWKLQKLKTQSKAVKLFAYYFITLAIATVSGGIIGHGLQYAIGLGWNIPTWIISMISITLIQRAAIIHAKPLLSRRTIRFFLILNIAEFITMVLALISTFNFFLVELHAAFGLVIFFSFELYIFIKKRNKESKILLIAVGVSALPAIVHLSKFSIDRWFNYNDIAHVLMAIAAYVFYLGAIKVHAIHLSSSDKLK